MLFEYHTIGQDGGEKKGTIDAVSEDVAISSLQRRGLTIVSIKKAGEEPFFKKEISLFSGVSNKDVVVLSRQIATLFESQVSALRTFTLLASESENDVLRKVLIEVADDVKGGLSLSSALGKHPNVFSSFYANMVKAGEESGKLNETFLYLADYLDRSYELTTKTRNALIYPAFVITTFIVVMILMLTVVIPGLSSVLTETGQSIPIYTRVVIGMSDFLVSYGIFFLILLIVSAFMLWQYGKSAKGRIAFSRIKLDTPYVGSLYRKLYLSRIADNMNTMLSSGISMVRAIEITASVVGNEIYSNILTEAAESVKSGSSLSETLSQYPEIPSIMSAMVKIGEETGELGNILKTLAHFYKREVDNAVDTLVGLIEPILIVALGLGVGLLLTSVLVPIYNITAGI